MDQLELFKETEILFERLCSTDLLRIAFKAVKANGGSPGIDGITIEKFETTLEEEIARLKEELISWRYKPNAVRRVEIPKPGGKGIRLLGIPCIRDRVVQAGLKLILEPIFDPEFSESSYGFRPGKNQRQAVQAAQRIVQSGKEHVVDIDLSKFFDRINQDRMLERVKCKVHDKRIIRLIGLTLRSGVMVNGKFERTEQGTTQGSPLSPLLSNIVLDELDKELERRGLEFCRFADDCNIFFGSNKAAERAMTNITKFIEKKMKLEVNQEKSKVRLAKHVKFLGMTILMGAITISTQAMSKAIEKVKELTPRSTHKTIERAVQEINSWYRGWSSYFSMTQYPSQLKQIEAHIRRRLRARLIRNMKRKRTIVEKLIKKGVPKQNASKAVYSPKSWWALSNSGAANKAFSNKWFETNGLFTRSQEQQPHWFSVEQWIGIS
jgi:RNA-directed DNA polymerase